MLKPIKSILFATDLSEKSRSAFDFAAALATRHQATIVLLHVTEKIPDYVESRLKGLFGDAAFEKITQDHERSVQESLIAKKSSGSLIRAALERFCAEAGIDDQACGYHSREVVVRKGEVVDEIIAQSLQHCCDLIVMGGRKRRLKRRAVGSVIKEVLRRSDIPVLVVPSET